MQKFRHTYLIRIQYLGFRYSGWQIQPGQRTVESMLSKTLRFVLTDIPFKILGAGRTDAKVSALDTAFELFLENPLSNIESFFKLLNKNFPPDIRALTLEAISSDFNIIKDAKTKEYVYLFSFGDKNHPFCAPFLANILENLDVEAMKIAARLFEGTHDFCNYTVKENRGNQTKRNILSCVLKENQILTAGFFPKNTYALHVQGAGFLRYQIRMIMGALVQLGKGEISMEDIEASLKPNPSKRFSYIAPGSGLHLHQLIFDLSSEQAIVNKTPPSS
ncbi:MAG: tRNA pseudouridine(38-40) synthase TruA [Pricia sp.]